MSDDNHDRSIFFLWSINYPENQPVPCLIPIWGCRHIRTRSLGRSIIGIMCHHMPSVTLKNDRHLPFAWATDFFQRISTMRRFTTSADPFSLMNTLGPNLPVSLKKKFSQCLEPWSILENWGKVSFPAIRLKSSGVLPTNEANGSLAYTA